MLLWSCKLAIWTYLHCRYSSYASVIMTPLALSEFCENSVIMYTRRIESWFSSSAQKGCSLLFDKGGNKIHHMTLVSMMMFCEFGPFTFLVVWQIQCFSFQLLFIISRTILGLFPLFLIVFHSWTGWCWWKWYHRLCWIHISNNAHE